MENTIWRLKSRANYAAMKSKPPSEDTLDRLAKAIMQKHSVGYGEALAMLGKFRLNLVCDANIARSSSLQAALLTSINCGKRAFHGGVFVSMPHDVPNLLHWPGTRTLNQVAKGLGAKFVGLDHTAFSHTLYFGAPKNPVADSLLIVCSGWRGGVAPAGMLPPFVGSNDFSLGGVLAGALGVAKGFLRISGLSTRYVENHEGVSLWRPDLDWTSTEAEGPPLEFLPKNIWMLGLGHLGQAFLWNFALLPYKNPSDVSFVLQDFDRVVQGNFSSGMLCEKKCVNRPKTRICAEWLEARGFHTVITERPFDSHTKRTGNEPFVACCGFDSAEPRRLLESAGFDLVIECALGGDTARFDRIIFHTFPDAAKTSENIWASTPVATVDQKIVAAFKRKGDCGIIAETLAMKAISTSFVGAFAGALVAGELLRALHGGVRCQLIHAQLRHNDKPKVVLKMENYQNRVARSGYCTALATQNIKDHH